MHGFINNQILVEVKSKGKYLTNGTQNEPSQLFLYLRKVETVFITSLGKLCDKIQWTFTNSYSHHMMQPTPHGQQIHPQDAKQRRNVLYHVHNQIPLIALTKTNSRVTMGKLLAASSTVFVPFIESVTRRLSKVN